MLVSARKRALAVDCILQHRSEGRTDGVGGLAERCLPGLLFIIEVLILRCHG